MDGQTDGFVIAIAYSALSMLSHAKSHENASKHIMPSEMQKLHMNC